MSQKLKYIDIPFDLLNVRASNVDTKAIIYNNDVNSVPLRFTVMGLDNVDLTGAFATIVMIMSDGSIFQHALSINSNIFEYLLTNNEQAHKGRVTIQVVIKRGTIEYASRFATFTIIGGLTDTVPIEKEVVISDFETLKRQIQIIKDDTLKIKSDTEGIKQQAQAILAEASKLESQYAPRLTNVEKQIENTSRQTVSLTHGTQVINAGDSASPLKVEIYGVTLVNLLGKKGKGDNTTSLDVVGDVYIEDGYYRLDTSKKGYISVNLDIAKKYIVVAEFDNSVGNDDYPIRLNGTGDFQVEYGSLSKTNKYRKLANIGGSVYVTIWKGQSSVKVKDIRLYEISQETYDKIGVSLTDADVERMFPYVDSVQHVKNPVVQVEGENFINPNNWESGGLNWDGVTKITGSGRVRNIDFTDVLPSTKYSISIKDGLSFIIFEYSSTNAFIKTSTGGTYANSELTFTTSPSTRKIKITVNSSESNLLENINNFAPMLNVGNVKPFIPRNPSYLYAETILAGIEGNKKDILYRNESLNPPRLEKRKVWETDVMLDGSLAWIFHSDSTGYKRARLPITSNWIDGQANLVKFDGKIIPYASDSSTQADLFQNNSNGSIYISIADTDSGWTEAMTGTQITADLIKSYFYGWKYTGNGTTHSWVSLVDGSAPPTNTVAYCSTNMAPNFTPYKLMYQLANPVIEPVTVEGDLVVNGQTQVTVGSEFTYTTDDKGKRSYTITPANQRKGSNLTDVRATFANNIRTALDETVKKQSDIVTEVSIHTRSLIDLYVRLKALEG